MSAFHLGDTIKITGENRHPAADNLLIDHLDLSKASILDVGASDGSTSVELIRKLPDFKSYTIADLFLNVRAAQQSRRVFFYDPAGTCILVVGPRAVAWPSQSKTVRALYAPLIARGSRSAVATDVLLLNPEARSLVATDERVNYAVHNVFHPWQGPTPDVIKVANLLRRLYFSDDAILVALRALLRSLKDGGHLLLVDNPRLKGISARAGLYRREGGRFVPVDHIEEKSEIDDLVGQVQLATG